jgi:hypothetical protein
MFASPNVATHLLRGVVGLGGLATAVSLSTAHPFLSFALLPPALLALRGCPTCWTIGLIQTVAARCRGLPVTTVCKDGGCAIGREP